MVRTGIIIYIIIMSIISFCQMGIDKKRAMNQRWRITERTLFLTAGIGGSFGCFLGMYIFRHKTRQMRFVLGIPALMLVHVFLLYLVFFVLV